MPSTSSTTPGSYSLQRARFTPRISGERGGIHSLLGSTFPGYASSELSRSCRAPASAASPEWKRLVLQDVQGTEERKNGTRVSQENWKSSSWLSPDGLFLLFYSPLSNQEKKRQRLCVHTGVYVVGKRENRGKAKATNASLDK